jgi:uncharacterized protein YajQ (UPF0234 family)
MNMPSFDVVSEVDTHELTNAVDQANREVETRFDFKGTGSRFDRDDEQITLISKSDFQLKQMLDILRSKMSKRGVDVRALDAQAPELLGQEARQRVLVRQGLDRDMARKIVKAIKDRKLKVQAQVQGEQVRVSGKKRDDLQDAIAGLKEAEFGLPLQFVNFRD